MSKDNENKSLLTDEQKKQYILGKLEHVEKDIKNLENFIASQFANQIKTDPTTPINLEKEPFKSEFESTITATKNEKNKLGGTNATISLKATLTDFIEDLQEKGIIEKKELKKEGSIEEIIGANLKDFPEIEKRVKNYEKGFREKFSTNEKVTEAIKDRVKNEIVNESMPLVELEDGQPIQMKMQDAKNLINTIYKNIEMPDKLYEEMAINQNNVLREGLANNVIGPEIKKAFGHPPITLKNSLDEPYEVTTLDSSKLTPENIENFTKAVDNKLKEVNDRLIVNEKIFEGLKQTNPSISDTQTKQFENFLSKLDTQSLEKNKERMVNFFNSVNKKAELSPLEKIYTTITKLITGQGREEYLAKKVEKILMKEYPNYKTIDDTKNYKSSIQTATPVQIKQEKAKHIQQALSAPVKPARRNFTKSPIQTPNTAPSFKKDSSKQHGI